MTNTSKKEYRRATHQVHMEQERWKRELQKFKTLSLHQLHPSTLHTEVSVEGEQLENVYVLGWVCGCGVVIP